MEALILDGDNLYPSVVFDSDNGTFRISGRSVMDNAEDFYRQALDWLDEFASEPTDVELTIDLKCFNIASSKRILFILYKLEEIRRNSDTTISVNWCHTKNEDDMLEVGQDFAVMVNIPFNFCVCTPHQEAVLA